VKFGQGQAQSLHPRGYDQQPYGHNRSLGLQITASPGQAEPTFKNDILSHFIAVIGQISHAVGRSIGSDSASVLAMTQTRESQIPPLLS
jgi:hypothetical protein